MSKTTSDKALEEFISSLETQGMACGEIIGEYLQRSYPKATVFKFYRSAIAFQQIPKTKRLKVIACGDPHCMGRELTPEELKKWTTVSYIEGDRFGPILNVKLPEQKAESIYLSTCH
jgi:hypothetical protein